MITFSSITINSHFPHTVKLLSLTRGYQGCSENGQQSLNSLSAEGLPRNANKVIPDLYTAGIIK